MTGQTPEEREILPPRSSDRRGRLPSVLIALGIATFLIVGPFAAWRFLYIHPDHWGVGSFILFAIPVLGLLSFIAGLILGAFRKT